MGTEILGWGKDDETVQIHKTVCLQATSFEEKAELKPTSTEVGLLTEHYYTYVG